jgi:hypothetical protein
VRRGRRRPAAPPLPPDPEALAVRPVRTASWSEKRLEEGGQAAGGTEPEAAAAGDPAATRVVVERPLPPVRSISGLLQRISALTGVRRLRLDAPGSFVWRRMDGSRSVGELAAALRLELGRAEAGEPAGGPGEGGGEDPAGEVERRVVRFVAMLRREGLVGLPGLDDRRIEAWRARSGGAEG